MKILLVSTYELGHQPLHVASPAAALVEAGHDVRTIDLSVEMWDPALAGWADAVGFSVPMHTAMRLALEGAAALKETDPAKPVCFYGLYATTSARDGLVDRAIAGEYETELVAWASGLTNEQRTIDLGRQPFKLPVRASLPPLDRYARLAIGADERIAGYVEASHGCAHRCRHCPVPVVYDGRTRRVPVEVVIDDIGRQVEMGAMHITIGDPDFLNRSSHSMQVVHELHTRYPRVTYDITTKVEHILKHVDLLPELASTGCLFAITAYECMNDDILRFLDKGHTAAEASEATKLLRRHGIEPRPSWLPFMPWTTVDDVADIIDFIIAHDLVGNVDPVQLSIRLLVPEGSLMLDVPEMQQHLGPYDPETLSYSWIAADPRTVDLQQQIARRVEDAAGSNAEIFCDVASLVHEAVGRPAVDRAAVVASAKVAPRLTEAWFCCAEPTKEQFASISAR
ncbi:MAG: CUAEP/CCAEP-tail radical SAM protein [Actinomycetota bacterium]